MQIISPLGFRHITGLGSSWCVTQEVRVALSRAIGIGRHIERVDTDDRVADDGLV